MAFKGTPGMIADAFQNSFRQKRAEIQRQREIEQEMANRDRQEGLLQFWKQKNFEEQVRMNNASISNQKEDNIRQNKVADAQIKNYDIDNENQAKRTKIAEDELRENKAFRKWQKENNIKQQPKGKGRFSQYFAKREGYLGQIYTDKDGNDIPRTPGEIATGLRSARDLAISLLTPNAQRFYVERFQGKPSTGWDFINSVNQAVQQGLLDEEDAMALADFNDIRGDWGEIPKQEQPQQETKKEDKPKDYVHKPKGLLDSSVLDEYFNPKSSNIFGNLK